MNYEHHPQLIAALNRCEKHAAMGMVHCKICAEACRACAAECRKN